MWVRCKFDRISAGLPLTVDTSYKPQSNMSAQTPCDGSTMAEQSQLSAVTSVLKSKLMNLAYNLKNNCIFQLPFVSRVPLDFAQTCDNAFLLGQHYDFSTRQQFFNSFEQVIWFSYRRLPNQCGDVGWGCMIRVVQMLLAQAITRADPHLHPNALIDLFRDEKQGPLSLSQICKLGHIQERWTSCAEILMISNSILADLRSSNKIGFNFQIFCDELNIEEIDSYRSGHFPKLLSIRTDVGDGKTIDAKYLFHLTQLMKDRRFVGLVSGQDTEALYVLGVFQQLAIILDPHYVQGQESFRTFFPKNPQGIKFTELSSGLTINFYVPDFEQFQELVSEFIYADRICTPHTCFGLRVGEGGWSESRRKGSDDFQLL